VDLSYLDDGSGTSILHEAARRRDLRLIELAVRAGADVFLRDRRGKMAYEGKDDKVKVFLRQCRYSSFEMGWSFSDDVSVANHDTTLIDQPVLELPTLKGYLNKYTNVAKGYSTRWFVLKGGVLSCTSLSCAYTQIPTLFLPMQTIGIKKTSPSHHEGQSP
jgi:hypothetical protein